MNHNGRKIVGQLNANSSPVTDTLVRSAYSYYSDAMQTTGDGRREVRGLKRVFAAALLSSASMLAIGMMGSSSAQAAPLPCTPAAVDGGTVYCIGTFNAPIDSLSGFEDLTVVVDPSTLIDTTGYEADSSGSNAGLVVSGDGTITVRNSGRIFTGPTSGPDYSGHHGIFAESVSTVDGVSSAVIVNTETGEVHTDAYASFGLVALGGEDVGSEASATNNGVVTTAGSEAHAVYAYAKYEAHAINNGSVEITGTDSAGVVAVSNGHPGSHAYAENTDEILVNGEDSVGLGAAGKYASADNSGTINTYDALNSGIFANGFVASADNSGTVNVYGSGSKGIAVQGGHSTVTNSGGIYVDGDDSNGVVVLGEDIANFTNTVDGTIAVDGSGSEGTHVTGANVSGNRVTFNNYGLIRSFSEGSYVDAVRVSAYDYADVTNTGTIGTSGYSSTALLVAGMGVDTTLTVTNGTIDGEDTATISATGEDGNAIVVSYFGEATIINNATGTISIDETGNAAYAIDVYDGINADVLNSGTIIGGIQVETDNTATFKNYAGGTVDLYSSAINAGINISGDGSATVENYGTIYSNAGGTDAVLAQSSEGGVFFTNDGSITTGAGAEDSNAVSLESQKYVFATNTGTITAGGYNGTALAITSEGGEDAYALILNGTNEGEDTALIQATGEDGDAITVQSFGDVGIVNYATGTISVADTGDEVFAISVTDGADAGIFNYGTIIGGVHVDVADEALFRNFEGGSVRNYNVANSAGVDIYAVGDVTFDNAGSIYSAPSAVDAVALDGYSGSVYFTNSGSISTGGEAEYADAVSIHAKEAVYATNFGTISAGGYGGTALSISGESGDDTYVVINNGGGEDEGNAVITGAEGSYRYAIDVTNFGDLELNNYGDITVYDTAHSQVLAINADEGNNADFNNYGRIVGGVYAQVSSDVYFTNQSDGSVTNDGTNNAAIELNGDIAKVFNHGTISSSKDGVYGVKISSDSYGSVRSSGSITTQGDGADGIRISSDKGAGARIDETGSVKTYGNEATGIYVQADEGLNAVANLGTIATTGEDSDGIIARASGSGANGYVFVYNSNSITTSGDSSTGVKISASEHGELTNTGTISTSGSNSDAVQIRSGGIATSVVTNSGLIEATGESSDAISASGDTIEITNELAGTISATDGYAIVAYADGGFYEANPAFVHIVNAGQITGDVFAEAKYGYYDNEITLTNTGTITGDVTLAASDELSSYGYSSYTYVLNQGTITGDLNTVSDGGYDHIVIDGGKVGGGIYTGSGEDFIEVSGTGASIAYGIHSSGSSTVSFNQDDTVTFSNLTDENSAISGAYAINFNSGVTAFNNADISMNEGTITVGEDATFSVTGEDGLSASGTQTTRVYGTLHVDSGSLAAFSGNVQFNSGSTFNTAIVSGSGGVVQGDTVNFASGSTIYADLTINPDVVVGQDILIATADQENGVSDEGAVVDDNTILFNFDKVMNGAVVTSGSADTLSLRVTADETALGTVIDVDGTINQTNMAAALDEFIQTQPINNALVTYLSQFGTPEAQRAALDQIVKDSLPDESSSPASSVFASTELIFNMIMNHLSGGGFSVATADLPKFAMAQNTQISMNDANPIRVDGEKMLGGDGDGGWALWGRVGGNDIEYTPSAVNGFDSNAWGATIGLDGNVAPALRVGVSLFHTDATVDENGTAPNSNLDVTGNGFMAYLTYRPGDWFVNGAVGYSRNNFDSSRRSIGGTNVASYDANQYVMRAEVGKLFRSNAWEFAPNIGVAYNKLDIDGYTETGPLPISVAARDVDSVRGSIGVNTRYISEMEDGSKLIPEFGLSLINEFGNPAGTITGSVIGGGAFSTAQKQRDDLSFGASAGLTYQTSGSVSVRLSYDGEYQSDYKDHTIAAAVRFDF